MSGAVEGVALPAPEDLRPWGYAPGNYVFKCQNCPPDLSMYDRMSKCGDKRAWRCREHAIAARDAAPVAIEARTTPPARSYADGVELTCVLFEEAIGEGYPTPLNKRDQCDHGKFGWEDCIACYDDALLAKIAAIRLLSQGGKA